MAQMLESMQKEWPHTGSSEASSVQTALKTFAERTQGCTEALDKVLTQVQTMDTSSQEIQKLKKDLEDRKEEHEPAMNRAQEAGDKKLEDSAKELHREQEAKAQVSEQLETKDKELVGVWEALQIQQKDNAQVSKQLETKNNELIGVRKDAAEKLKELSESKGQLVEANRKLQKAANLQSQLDEAEKRLKELDSLETQLGDVESALRETAPLKAQLDKANEKLEELEPLRTQLQVAEKKIEGTVSLQSELETAKKSLETTKSSLKTRDGELQKANQKLVKMGTTHDGQIESLNTRVSMAEQARDAVNRALESANRSIESTRSLLKTCEGELHKANEKLVQWEQSHHKQLESLNKRVSTPEQAQDRASKALETANQSLSASKKEVDELQPKYEAALANASKVRQKMDALKGQLLDADAEFEDVAGKLSLAEQEICNIKTELNDEIRCLQDQFTDVSNRLTVCEGREALLADELSYWRRFESQVREIYLGRIFGMVEQLKASAHRQLVERILPRCDTRWKDEKDAEYQTRYEQKVKANEESCQASIAKAAAGHKAELDKLDSAWRSSYWEGKGLMNSQSLETIDRLHGEHQSEIESLKTEHDAALRGLQQQIDDFESSRKVIRAEARNSFEDEMEAALAKLRDEHQQTVKPNESVHEKALETLRAKHERNMKTLTSWLESDLEPDDSMSTDGNLLPLGNGNELSHGERRPSTSTEQMCGNELASQPTAADAERPHSPTPNPSDINFEQFWPGSDAETPSPRGLNKPKRARPQPADVDDNGSDRKRQRRAPCRPAHLEETPAQPQVGGRSTQPQPTNDKALKTQAARDSAAQLRSMFLVAYDASPEENASFEESLTGLFRHSKPLETVIRAIDAYCTGPMTSKPAYPPPCLFAKLVNTAAGAGGSQMTQTNYKACKSKTKNRVCLWAKFAPNVATGFGPRNEQDEIEEATGGRIYDLTSSPRTQILGGSEVRWILKRRKQSVDDPDEEDWDIGGVVV